MTDAITFLLCARAGCSATKTYALVNGKIRKLGYSAGMWFGQRAYLVESIQDLSAVLGAAEYHPEVFAIRGALRDGLAPQGIFRRRMTEFETPAAGHHWIMLDLDKITVPPGLSLSSPVATCDHLIGYLPTEFHNATYRFQFSSSAGMGSPDVVSAHIWFWIDKPVLDESLREWAKAVNEDTGRRLVDPAMFNAVQIHYTAAPIFGEGVADPIPVRSGLVEKQVHEVALALRNRVAAKIVQKTGSGATPGKNNAPAPSDTSSDRGNAKGAAPRRSGHGFAEILTRIGDQPGGEGFHDPILRCAASYLATHGTEGTDIGWLYQTIRAAVLAADRSMHSDAEVEDRASSEHIMAAIESAIDKFGEGGERRQRQHLQKGVQPHFHMREVPLDKAEDRMQKFFKGKA